MHITFLKSLILSLCCVLCVATISFASKSIFPENFTYYAEKQDLSLVLTQFSRTHGYSASISPNVKGEMSGRFDNVDSYNFLEGIRSAFGVSWYHLDNTLFYYHETETIKAFITPRAMTAERMFNMLNSSGVFSSQLMPSMNPDSDMIIVNGPQSYISQINLAASSFEEAQTSNYVMEVFPIKYAWADDITINSLDQTVTVPGIATILRSMVLGVASSSTRVVQQQASVDSLRGQGLASQGSQATPAAAPAQAQNPAQGTSVNIMADPRVNSVIINDAAYRMPYYRKVIADLDKPVELVEIHAAIVDIDSDYKRELGVTLQGSVGLGDDGINSEGSSGIPPILPTAGGVLSTIYKNGTDFFLARIEALEEDGEARVLGRPSVLTVDNVQASLENTSTYYIPIQGNDSSDLFKVEAGTILSVTPHIIRENGRTSIKLAVNVQDNQDNQQGQQIGALPPIKQTKINTQAIVGEGESLLIGGYYYEQVSEGESGIPGLKNIPILGNLFKTKSKQSQRMERLILITPRVIRYNEVTKMPDHLDDPAFHRAPTQNDYEARIPVPVTQPKGAGCSRKASSARVDDSVSVVQD